MKNNKKIMLSLAMVAVIAVAAVGIGFAYQASTSNTDNNVEVKFYKIGVKDGSSVAFDADPDNWTEQFSNDIEYDTITAYDGTTFKIDGGLENTVIHKTIATLGLTTLIAFDQKDAAITAPEGKSHVKLNVSIASGGTGAHKVNENFTIIAKIGEFIATDDVNEYTGPSGAATDNLIGFTALELDGTTYKGDLYVPKAVLSTGFTVYLGAYVTNEPAETIIDEDMEGSGLYDHYVLHAADITFSIADDGWITEYVAP